jgi:hypothetical protein
MQHIQPEFVTLTYKCSDCTVRGFTCGFYKEIHDGTSYKIPEGWSIYSHLNMGDFIACSKQCYDNLYRMYSCLR